MARALAQFAGYEFKEIGSLQEIDPHCQKNQEEELELTTMSLDVIALYYPNKENFVERCLPFIE